MPERGTYVDLGTLKAAMGETTASSDASLLAAAEDASRYIDSECGGRRFYTVSATRYYTARCADHIDVEDLLSVTTLKTDSDGDRVYETVWSATDYDLSAGGDYNLYPRWRISRSPYGSYYLPAYARGIEIAGVWGYGDGESASPWRATGVTITVATPTGTTLTASSSSTGCAPGMTLLVGTEQVYVTAVSGSTLTAERGVNGTTAAAHVADAVSIATYPRGVVRATLMIAEQMSRLEGAPFGVSGSQEMGVQTLSRDQQIFVLRVFGQYRRAVIA